MREIKFRAWDKKRKKMLPVLWLFTGEKNYTVQLVDFEERQHIVWNNTKNEVELMQYTGLKDKNGKEIYEGDILQQQKDKGQRFKVFWNTDGEWMVEDILDDPNIWNRLWAWAKVTEIIGNIYQNPKLLKGGD